MRQDADPTRRPPEPDWEAIEASPEFRKLVSVRRRLLNPLLAITALGLAIYTALLLVGGDSFLGDGAIGSFSWGLVLVVLMTFFIFAMAAIYSRISLGTLDPLVEEAKAAALRGQDPSRRERVGVRADEEPSR